MRKKARKIRAAAVARDKLRWDFEVAKQAEREEGKAEGIEIGEKKGVIQTAKAMITAGFDIETICKATGLSLENLA